MKNLQTNINLKAVTDSIYNIGDFLILNHKIGAQALFVHQEQSLFGKFQISFLT